MKKIYRYLELTSVILFLILLSSFVFMKSDNKTVQTSSIPLDNKTIGWGIKRTNDHIQPDLGARNKELINQYDGIAMGNPNDKYVYLTFDNGYEAGYTPSILKTLQNNNVKAAFFITAHFLNSQTDLVKQMIAQGHTVGNHTVNHKSMPSISDEEVKQEINKLHTAMFEKTGYEMKYFRPPKGEYSERILALTKSLGYKTVMWSLAYDDWDKDKQGREEYGKAKIIDNIHPGTIILLHGTSKDNANILDYCIKEIKKMGYEFKSLDEFMP